MRLGRAEQVARPGVSRVSERAGVNEPRSAFGGKLVLTTKEGLRYEIDGISGDLRRVTTPNGETLSYSPGGIASSTGLSVTFGRDARGRITSSLDSTDRRLVRSNAGKSSPIARLPNWRHSSLPS